jgi:hypothetical protein
MHFTFTFIMYLYTPTYVSVLCKTVFRGLKNYVHSTSSVNSGIILCNITVHTAAWDTDDIKQQDIITKCPSNIQNQEQNSQRCRGNIVIHIAAFYYFDTKFDEFLRIFYSVFLIYVLHSDFMGDCKLHLILHSIMPELTLDVEWT